MVILSIRQWNIKGTYKGIEVDDSAEMRNVDFVIYRNLMASD